MKAKNAPQGEIYAKWKRNSNRKVGREGDEEEAGGAADSGASTGGGGGWGSGGGRGRRGGWGDAGSGGGAWGGGGDEGGGGVKAGRGAKEQGGRVVRDELKTKGQIRKTKEKVRWWWFWDGVEDSV